MHSDRTLASLWRMRLENWVRATLIMIGLMLVLGLIGWVLGGWAGVAWSLLLAAATLVFSRRLPARTLLSYQGATLLRRGQAPQLYTILDELYHRAGIRCAPALYCLPTSDLNAFAVGNAADGGIAVTDGLLRRLSLREVAGVLAHEACHLRHNDTWVMSMAAMVTEITVVTATLGQVLLLALLPWVLTGRIEVPLLGFVALIFAPTLSTLLQLSLSRNREFAADMEAAALTGDPVGLAAALATLERYQGSWLETLFGYRRRSVIPWLRTHPSTAQRIARLKELMPRRMDALGDWPRTDGPFSLRHSLPLRQRRWPYRNF
ncbi:MAG: M48 family metalloprotease [Ectothiorhodospiraceae bacterium]|nr:M48 family metalloprotease [Ectothiorhodospiraceae bacterium]MCH8503862.1 zinc metalloprotease HtpX [Ectothiorhodospiraceae bacterium]